uniref:Uncharacterized protein n=1 Tax=Romanomermis culicivorax TaxID=13658 RepID=A0A915HIB8_ROMCU
MISVNAEKQTMVERQESHSYLKIMSRYSATVFLISFFMITLIFSTTKAAKSSASKFLPLDFLDDENSAIVESLLNDDGNDENEGKNSDRMERFATNTGDEKRRKRPKFYAWKGKRNEKSGKERYGDEIDLQNLARNYGKFSEMGGKAYNKRKFYAWKG